ncbi:MAG: 30S ribosome-binding factor RbfA [Desulfovibrio sp.]|jgi:ribosome-binding factor A|nr:30S ribosome-binding factor RbfA [Desulfovibrio sp.]
MKTTSSRRSIRLADQIQREIGSLLLEDIQDPRLEMVTISGVRMNRDLRIAEVLYTMSGGDERESEVQEALEHAAGFLRSNLGRRLKLKFIPELRFARDTFLEDMVYAQSGQQDR